MKVLLDENFPLGLVRVLRNAGLEVDHIITLGWRGASDARIRQQLADHELIFLTQDDDFLSGAEVAATIVVSRVRQSRPLDQGIQVWSKAVNDLVETRQVARRFELTDDGVLLPWSKFPLDR